MFSSLSILPANKVSEQWDWVEKSTSTGVTREAFTEMECSSSKTVATNSTNMINLKWPRLKLGGNMSENFQNFELRFHDFCIQADYRNLAKASWDRERRLLQETFAGNISTTIRHAGWSSAGDLLHHWTPDNNWWLTKTMDLDGKTATSLHRIGCKFTLSRQIQIVEHSAKPTQVHQRMRSEGQTGWQPMLVQCTNWRYVPWQIRLWSAQWDNESWTAKMHLKSDVVMLIFNLVTFICKPIRGLGNKSMQTWVLMGISIPSSHSDIFRSM